MAIPEKQELIPLIAYAFVSRAWRHIQVNAVGALQKSPLYGCRRTTFQTIEDAVEYIRGGNFPTPPYSATQTARINTQKLVDDISACCSLPDEIEHRKHFNQYAHESLNRLALDEAVCTCICAICNVADDSVIRTTLRSAIQIFGECSVKAEARYLPMLMEYDRMQPI